ncbi:CoB--CoM heterodisulfide reductase iron-sulfur subunit B family protein [Ammonifex thiophilus]|uniref:Heterodisulfide reductase subunit B n=1 Tax=Ammonifex thiophilus TaxID=444093 RepID=A0A3D8P637_9THEO|nr:CoB--CoM heterodisulfide reductase iron-sulfur subunit B family protein [Ammonifex thiophilus]RDV83977.1 heterodisulfide reductase subunit B [Ammonifex thiophilus]
MKLAYYPGCSLKGTAREYDLSTRLVARHLGLELVEIPDWNCCGATAAHSTSHFLAVALPARVLALAEDMGLDILSPCAACYQRLRAAQEELKRDPELKRQVEGALGRTFEGRVRVFSLLEALAQLGEEALAAQVVRPLKGMQVACYYGCLLVRPPLTSCDDPEQPQLMEKILAPTKVDTLDWGGKNECCGASLIFGAREVALNLIKNILHAAAQVRAHALVTACPLCHANLDLRQKEVNRFFGTNFAIPVFYLSQLLGIAMGLNPRDLGLGSHFVDPQRALRMVGS